MLKINIDFDRQTKKVFFVVKIVTRKLKHANQSLKKINEKKCFNRC